MFTNVFWKDAFERASKTFAQVIVAVFAVAGTTVFNADWKAALATAGTAVVVSFLTSVLSLVKASKYGAGVRTASLVNAVKYDEPVV